MSREDQHFRLRLPADLREKVEAAAAESRRSLTAEILARLEASFAAAEGISITPEISSEAMMLGKALLQAVAETKNSGKNIRISLAAVDENGNEEPVLPKLPSATPSAPTTKRPSRAR